MPNDLPNQLMETADAAIVYARQVRKHHARRTDINSPNRAADLDLALERLAGAMKPLRSEIGRFPYGPQTTIAEHNRQTIRDLSKAIQRERVKLWKMKNKRRTAP
jgi:hypothetical protein